MPEAKIGYLPVIPQPPTDTTVTLELIRRSDAVATKLVQLHCVITVDQPAYAKAQEVCCGKSEVNSRRLSCVWGLSMSAVHF